MNKLQLRAFSLLYMMVRAAAMAHLNENGMKFLEECDAKYAEILKDAVAK